MTLRQWWERRRFLRSMRRRQWMFGTERPSETFTRLVGFSARDRRRIQRAAEEKMWAARVRSSTTPRSS